MNKSTILLCAFGFLTVLGGCKAASGIGQSVSDLANAAAAGDVGGVSSALLEGEAAVESLGDEAGVFLENDEALVAGLSALVVGGAAFYLARKKL